MRSAELVPRVFERSGEVAGTAQQKNLFGVLSTGRWQLCAAVVKILKNAKKTRASEQKSIEAAAAK